MNLVLKTAGAGVLVLAVFLSANPARGAVLTLTPNEDAFISERFPPPTGSMTEMIIGTQGNNLGVNFAKNRGLIRFGGLSQIPAGATITSARFTLTVTRAPLSAPADWRVHRLLREWDGTECTWTLRLEPDETWGEPGGASGVDFVTTSSARQLVGGPGSYTFDSTPELIADVTTWVNSPASNSGWLIKAADDATPLTARRVAASGGLASAPSLEIRYELPSPPRITDSQLNGGQFCLRFEVKPGKSYVVEHREALDDGQWTALTNLPPAAAAETVLICDPRAPTHRFYRVGER